MNCVRGIEFETGVEEEAFYKRFYKVREELPEMSLGDFRLKDLAPILRMMNEFHGETMLNDVSASDVEQLEQRISEIKTAK